MTPYNPAYWKKSNGSFGMGQYMISGMQSFPNKIRQDAEAIYLKSLSGAERDRKQSAVNELYAEAKTNYYHWLVLKKKNSLISENEKMLNFMIKDAEIRYKNGFEKISAYYKATAALGNEKNQELIIRNEIKQRQLRLNSLMNRNSFQPFDIDTGWTISKLSTLNIDTNYIITSRSDVKTLENEMMINQLSQNLELAKRNPEFGLRYDHMFGFGGLPMQFTLMATVKLPMVRWAIKGSKANVESLQLKSEAINLQKQSIINEAIGLVLRSQADIDLKKTQLKLFEENIIPALKKNYQTILIAYGQNTEELFALFDAWQSLSMARLEYLNVLDELLFKQVELEKTLEIK